MKLVRYNFNKRETFGKLYKDDGDLVCYTIELPYKNNTKLISCVPCGRYELYNYNSAKFPNTVTLSNPRTNVYVNAPNNIARSKILFHAANVSSQLEGCIAPGMLVGEVYNKPAVLQSRIAMKKILPLLKESGFLIITTILEDV